MLVIPSPPATALLAHSRVSAPKAIQETELPTVYVSFSIFPPLSQASMQESADVSDSVTSNALIIL